MIVAHHGRPSRSPYFHRRFAGGQEATDDEGPGFYFTTDRAQARGHAGNDGCVITAQLNVPEWVPRKGKLPELAATALWASASQQARQNFLDNWGGDFTGAWDNIRKHDDGEIHECLQRFWYDLYTPSRSAEFLRAISLFYQGVEIKHPECTHYVIFDPDVIEVLQVLYAQNGATWERPE